MKKRKLLQIIQTQSKQMDYLLDRIEHLKV